MSHQNYPESDPRHHTGNIKRMLNDAITHVRSDVSKVDDPNAQGLFETTAEVLNGLVKAYDHDEGKSEKAWQR